VKCLPNPKYFLFRDKPLVLLTATEHYGSVINRPFDFEKYLRDAADKKMTLSTVHVPARTPEAVKESGQAASAGGVKFVRMEAGAAVYEVGSGWCSFVSEM